MFKEMNKKFKQIISLGICTGIFLSPFHNTSFAQSYTLPANGIHGPITIPEAPTQSQQSAPQYAQALRLAFLKDVRERLMLFNKMNLAYLKDLERCYSGKSSTIVEETVLLNRSQPIQNINLDGQNDQWANFFDKNTDELIYNESELREVDIDTIDIKNVPTNPFSAGEFYGCDFEKKKIRNNIAQNYPRMRRYLFLYNHIGDEHFHLVIARQFRKHLQFLEAQKNSPKRNIGHNRDMPTELPQFFYRTSVQSPLDPGATPAKQLYNGIDLPNPPFTLKEVNDALTNSDNTFNSLVSTEQIGINPQFPININGFAQMLCEKALGSNSQGCALLKISHSDKNKSLFFENTEYPSEWAKHYINNIERHLAEQVRIVRLVRKSLIAEFMEIVQKTPYITLLTSAKPTDEEIHGALKIMLKAAIETNIDFEKKYKKLSKREITEDDLRDLMQYGPVVLSVLDIPGEEMNKFSSMAQIGFDDAFTGLQTSYRRDKLVDLGLTMGAVIGSLVACWFGGKYAKIIFKPIKLLRLLAVGKYAEAITPFCISITTLPINAWFLYDSIQHYHETFREIFSSANGVSYIHEMKSLSSSETGILLSALMAPIGTGTVLKAIRNAGIKLSRPLLLQMRNNLLKSRGP